MFGDISVKASLNSFRAVKQQGSISGQDHIDKVVCMSYIVGSSFQYDDWIYSRCSHIMWCDKRYTIQEQVQ